MTTTQPATVNTSSTVHVATITADGHKGIDCGAIRYRNAKAARINLQPADTAITCTKCIKAHPAPVVEPVRTTAHSSCTHEATKAARAACRKARNA